MRVVQERRAARAQNTRDLADVRRDAICSEHDANAQSSRSVDLSPRSGETQIPRSGVAAAQVPGGKCTIESYVKTKVTLRSGTIGKLLPSLAWNAVFDAFTKRSFLSSSMAGAFRSDSQARHDRTS